MQIIHNEFQENDKIAIVLCAFLIYSHKTTFQRFIFNAIEKYQFVKAEKKQQTININHW